MDERTFREYMRQAQGITGEYARGYQRGLRRHHHGTAFGTDAEHRRWLGIADEPHRRELGRGYQDGFAGREPTPEPAREAR